MALVETLDYGQKIRVYSATITPTEVATITTSNQDHAVSGIAATDYILGWQAPKDLSCCVGAVSVDSADTVSIQFVNPTAGNLTPAAGTWYFFVAAAEV